MDIWSFINVTEYVASFVSSCLQESTLNKVAKTEIETARMIAEDISKEKSPRDCLNRMLTHLESAFVAYSKTIGTWDIFDFYKVLWNQLETYNKLCVLIAVIHKSLGNQELVKKWLIDNMSEKGPWELNVSSGTVINITGLPSFFMFDHNFYSFLLGSDISLFDDKIIKPSDEHYEAKVNYNPEDYNPATFWIRQP